MIIVLLTLGYILQYNPYFLSEYLWKHYWTGSTIRTAISLSCLAPSLLLTSFSGIRLRRGPFIISLGMALTGVYGLCLGSIFNAESKYVVADSIIWFETAAYLLLLGSISYEAVIKLLRVIITYSILSNLVSLGLFWSLREEIAVAALIGGERVVRLVDLQAPLILILLYLKALNFSRTVIIFGTLVLVQVIFLGLFRSVWAALILAIITNFIVYPRLLLRKRVLGFLGISLGLIFAFEWVYYHLTDVNSVLLGRVIAGIGTEDSEGRVSSTVDVISQFVDNPIRMLIGNGFGAMAWFVNDFGDGEVRAFQPVGSLSNYLVALVFQIGVIWFLVVLLPLFLGAVRFWRSSHIEVRRILLVLMSYIVFQWLTFPSHIHFPTAMTLAAGMALLGYVPRLQQYCSCQFDHPASRRSPM
ncbi:MAG TPA: hypothetical protein VNK46_12495 [Nitrospiraceae bacterium]|nr:hypothetical protein [Nitrospiraceae bacterium]